ncbi:MAG: phosphoribosylaminoimidazolesuccinocarboxamide synthase [Pseudomonadota bacterium]
MVRRRLIYDGKAKTLYEGPEQGTLIQHFKDDATAFNAQKRAKINGKGILNNRISEYFMTALTDIGIANHFIRRLNMREQLIRAVEVIPIEVIVRNYAAGSLVKRLGLARGDRLPRSIVEFCYKSDELQDPLVAEEHITAFGWAAPQELDDVMAMALRINDFLCGLLYAKGLQLVDCKFEFGRLVDEDRDMRIILADEISPDTCRLWDLETGHSLDKDCFREDKGDIAEAYHKAAARLGLIKGENET